MTTTEPDQHANDMLIALSNQRNAAQNECVQLAAQIMALQRQVADKDTEIAALKSRVAQLEPKPEPQANGVAAEA